MFFNSIFSFPFSFSQHNNVLNERIVCWIVGGEGREKRSGGIRIYDKGFINIPFKICLCLCVCVVVN